MSRIKDKYLVKNYLVASAGDIREEQSFSLVNNQAAAADITGFAFANGTVRSFSALVCVIIDATVDLYEVITIDGVQRGSDWSVSIRESGDDSGVDFSITTSGQLQYQSQNYGGFVSGTIRFRATTLSI